MIVHVANPIYDSVFKFMMEDERVAKTILSALLKKEVLAVTIRPHEYSNTTRDSLSMFRIDFAAQIREDNGEEQLVLIELQKTWLDTETLRFRQYLGAQYNSQRNIKPDSRKGYAYPMIAVYLLGHRVGKIEEPVIYVNHKAYDYNGKELKDSEKEPFVESLIHNSIIVQIPLLRGQVNNKLDKVLSIFDQTKKDELDNQVLNIDEASYTDDADMMHIIHRLTAAAADSEMRQDMNVEDEYFKAIEDRDTAIMQRDKRLNEQESRLNEQATQLNEQATQLNEQKSRLNEQATQLNEQESRLNEQATQLKEKDGQLKEKDGQLKEKETMLKSMVQAMLQQGMSVQSIAQLTHCSEAEISRFLDCSK